MGQPVTEDFVIKQDTPGSGWFSVKKEGKLIADFYVWAWIGKVDHLLEPVLGKGGSWTCSEFFTEYHEFLRFEGKYDGRLAAFYIPVTPDYNENWLILFDVADQTKVVEHACRIQEHIIKTYFYLARQSCSL